MSQAKILPVVGSRGIYTLLPPFDTLATAGVEYSCQAVRRISELIAYNEDPKTDVYALYGLSDAIYDDDLKNDAYIVSLQSAKGQWLYIPYRYIASYPSGDAIQYRTVMLQFSLQPLPVSYDYGDLMDRLEMTIRQTTGLQIESRVTQTSQITLIKREVHEARELTRTLNVTATTYAEENNQLRLENSRLQNALHHLEDYIKLNKERLEL